MDREPPGFYCPVSGRHNRSNSDTQNDESAHYMTLRRCSVDPNDDDEDFDRFWEDSRILDPKLNFYYDQADL